MSLDLRLESVCSSCNHAEEFYSGNYTYNVSRMWYEIYPEAKGMIDIEGLTGAQALPILQNAIEEMSLYPDRFIVLQHDNGWGSAEGFRIFLITLATECMKNPGAVWSACR